MSSHYQVFNQQPEDRAPCILNLGVLFDIPQIHYGQLATLEQPRQVGYHEDARPVQNRRPFNFSLSYYLGSLRNMGWVFILEHSGLQILMPVRKIS